MRTMVSAHRGSGMLALFLALALLAGCATPATYQGMVSDRFDIARQHDKSVSVSTSGGSETSSIGKPQISDADFTRALMESINQSKVFSQVLSGAGANYALQVAIISMEQPTFGGSFTVKMEAAWSLRRSDGAVVWQEGIRSTHTATMDDSMVGVTRLRLATEGAARENIKQGLAKISRLNL